MSRAPSKSRQVSCVICSIQFETRHSQGKYCSADCARQGARASWRRYGERNKTARRISHKKIYRKNRNAVQERIKAYRQTPKGKEVIKRARENSRRKFPEKYKARQAVLMALRAGILKKEPCRKCGEPRTQAHHSDYSAPLKVTWLCIPCHRRKHIIEDGKVAAVN